MKRIAVLTSGGDAPGMNAAIRAVVRCSAYHGVEIYGIEQGFEGLMDGNFRPMDARSVGAIIQRGGTILRTARSTRFMTKEGQERAVYQLKANGIDGLVIIGGDGSFHGAWNLHEAGVHVVGVPGTIDNDIAGTEMTIGFDTALNTALEAVGRLRDTASSHDRIFIVEVMGRHSGSIALSTAVGGGAEYVLIPEMAFDIKDLCRKLRSARANGKSYSLIIVAEGVMSGEELKKQLADQGYEAKVTVLGYIQRGGSPSSYDATLASRMGAFSVECLLAGQSGVMTGIQNGRMKAEPLTTVWEKQKQLNPELIDLVEKLSI